jgi:hypothetical protein
MAMRPYWNAIEPQVYLTLFSWMAPFKEGRSLLREFATKVDPKYARPTYLGHVVLTPVLKIVHHLTDICIMEEILEYNQNKLIRMSKFRHQITFYVLKQYLRCLMLDTILREGEIEDGITEDEELGGEDIAIRGGVTEILLNLPREYQRWNKYYKKFESESIKFKYGDNGDGTVEDMTRPMNVHCKIHASFKNCMLQRVTKKAKKTTNSRLDLHLHDTWNPYYITQGILEKKFIINKDDWNKERPVLYNNGQAVAGKPRGNSIAGKRKRKNLNYSEDGQDEEEGDEQEETNQYSQDSTDGDVQTGKPKAKKQKVNKSMQKATKEDTKQTEKELQEIIKKRIIEYIPKKVMEVIDDDEMCDHMVKDITTYYNTR